MLIIRFAKGTLSSLKRLMTTKTLLKIIKNPFHFPLKSLFGLEIFTFLF